MSALYRKYRPQDFDEVVGQQHIVRTLRNAVESGRVRHAYLFAGPRGTGKTSLAKILAKSLNCLEADGPTTTPCRHCESCRSIHDATALDVIELDAASNRGIDDIREIRERVGMQPAIGRRKVYILDEAHSLTTDASNALLKTLEEPPNHVVFVLCTTEPHRLLDTIKGRCQAFTFARPTVEEIVSVLARVATAEAITADDEALAVIARSARGSFRDAVSQLDQLATACAGQIGAEEARSLLGIVDERVLVEIVDSVGAGDARAALLAVDALASGGQDVGQLVGDLLGHLRLVLVTRECGEVPASAPLGGEGRRALADQAGRTDERLVVTLLDGLLRVLDELRDGGDPRLPLELELVRAARPSADRATDAILRRLDALEAGGARPAAPAITVPDVEPPAPAPPAVGDLARTWRQAILPLVAERRPSLAPNLEQAQPVREGDVLRLRFPASAQFMRSFADTDANRAAVADAAAAVLGERLRVVLETAADEPAVPAPAPPVPALVDETPASDDEVEAALVRSFADAFDAHEIEEER